MEPTHDSPQGDDWGTIEDLTSAKREYKFCISQLLHLDREPANLGYDWGWTTPSPFPGQFCDILVWSSSTNTSQQR